MTRRLSTAVGTRKRARVVGIIVATALPLAALSACGGPTEPAPDPYKDKFLNVAAVLDATTIQLADGRRIRQLGILAPEPGTCEAEKARDDAQWMVRARSSVSLRFEPGATTDQSGNQWAYIFYGSNNGGVQTSDFGIDSARRGWVSADPNSPVDAGYKAFINNGLTYAQNSARGRWSSLCKPLPSITPAPAAAETGSPSGKDTHVYVDTHRDHNLPDGALSGGFCRRHWWC
jgi:hypothetical protein